MTRRYEVIDHHIPKDDPEMLQVMFSPTDDFEGEHAYILTIIYNVHFFEQPADPYCWDSDMDFYGYTECDADEMEILVNHYKPEADTKEQWGLGPTVDDMIDLSEIGGDTFWKDCREMVQDNYVEYVRELREEL